LVSFEEYGIRKCRGVFFTESQHWDRVFLDIHKGFAYVNAPMGNTLSKKALAREVMHLMGGSKMRFDGKEVK